MTGAAPRSSSGCKLIKPKSMPRRSAPLWGMPVAETPACSGRRRRGPKRHSQFRRYWFYILSRPALTEEIGHFLLSEWISWSTSPAASVAEALTEFAGRICYMSLGDKQSSKTNAEYIANLIAQGHESVLEHVNGTFLLTGVSRAFTHQLVCKGC